MLRKYIFFFLVIESKTLQGDKGEHSFNAPGTFIIENTTVEFQKPTDREILKIQGPLGADFIIKVGCMCLCSLNQDIWSSFIWKGKESEGVQPWSEWL